jgi:ADP-heptose:LPS heptosyltransferase
MNIKKRHGVVAHKRNPNIPARVINVGSRRKNTSNNKIRLDKLLRSSRPIICIKRRLGGIGDVIMTTPLLESLKKLIPHCELVYATDLKYAQGALGHVIQHNPFVDKLISFSEIHEKEYDYIVDVTSTGLSQERSGSIPPNRIDMFASAVGVSIDENPVPTYIVTKQERENATKQIKENVLKGASRNDVKLIAIQARSNDARRTWPLPNVQELIKLLTQEKDIRVIVYDWGKTSSLWKTDDKVWAVADKQLPEVAAVIEQSDLIICPDSALLHVAGALDKNIISIFGPIPPECRINYYMNASAISLDLPCKNCWYQPRCVKTNNNLECLTKITPEMVYTAAVKKLKEPININRYVKYGQDISIGNQDDIILVTRSTDGIGDILMAANGIEALKTKYPNKQIHLACKNKLHDTLRNNDKIDKLLDITKGINYKRYYMIVDISSPCARYEAARILSHKKVEKSRVEIFAEALGTRNLIPDLLPRYYVSDQEKEEAKKFLNQIKFKNPDNPKLAIVLSSAEQYRNWPQKNYNELINILKDEYNIAIIHHERDVFYDKAIDACGLPFRRAMAILNECDGLVTVDTGTLHVAAALNIPTIALFGPIDYRARCKGYKNVIVVSSDLECIPCWRNSGTKCKQTGLVKCYSKCLESIPASRVADIVKEKI